MLLSMLINLVSRKTIISSGSALKCLQCNQGFDEGICGDNEEGTSVDCATFFNETITESMFVKTYLSCQKWIAWDFKFLDFHY